MEVLVIFARHPKEKAKTRISRTLGDRKTYELYKAFILDLVKNHKNQSYGLFISFTKNFHFPGVKTITQRGDDLGERMLNCFRRVKHGKTAIIGSDLPQLDSKTVTEAFNLLETADVVIGPAVDGGYYLIAMKRPWNIFSGIEWSTETVLVDTIKKIKEKKLAFTLLEKKRDIDTIEDLLYLKKELKRKQAPHTYDLLTTTDQP